MKGTFRMRTIKNLCIAALASAALLSSGFANAAAVISMTRPVQTNETSFQSAQANATDYTNSTVTPSDIVEATVTVPSRTTAFSGATEYYEACFFAQAGKVTSTSGSILLLVNGSEVLIARRTVQFASGSTALVGCHTAATPTKASFVVKLQGVSGDTAAFTVTDVHLVVRTFRINS